MSDPIDYLLPVEHRSLHEGICDRVRKLIVHLGLEPGEKIDEKLLCERLGVSRTPFREAMRVLAAEGLVTITPRRGVRVAPLTEQDLAETFPILGALEALAGELACARVDESRLGMLRRLQRRMVEAHDQDDLDLYFRLNEAIHAQIRDIAGNPSLTRMIEGFSTRVRRARYMANLSPARWAAAVEEHAEMLAALEARDGGLLGRLLKTHMANKHAALVAALREAGELSDEGSTAA